MRKVRKMPPSKFSLVPLMIKFIKKKKNQISASSGVLLPRARHITIDRAALSTWPSQNAVPCTEQARVGERQAKGGITEVIASSELRLKERKRPVPCKSMLCCRYTIARFASKFRKSK